MSDIKDPDAIMVTGYVYSHLHAAGASPEVTLGADGEILNAIIIKPDFMASRYRLTVERVDG